MLPTGEKKGKWNGMMGKVEWAAQEVKCDI